MRLDARALRALVPGLVLASGAAFAQFSTVDPDWKEQEAPPPPALSLERLIAVDVPGSTLAFGVDPASVAVSKDGIVRYVVVARSRGVGEGSSVNAMYEAVRCNTGEAKTYARHTPGAGWTAVREPEWKALAGNGAMRHSLVIARTGACLGSAPNRDARTIARDLRSGVDTRFANETR